MIDWTDRSIPDEVHVMMVDPHNLDIVRCELENLVLSDCSVSYGYNTDTRTSAKLATLFRSQTPIRVIPLPNLGLIKQ